MDLVAQISAAMREHDPLESWLTESHWDEDYWDTEAAEIARHVRSGMSAEDVHTVITNVLRASRPENFADDIDARQVTAPHLGQWVQANAQPQRTT